MNLKPDKEAFLRAQQRSKGERYTPVDVAIWEGRTSDVSTIYRIYKDGHELMRWDWEGGELSDWQLDLSATWRDT